LGIDRFGVVEHVARSLHQDCGSRRDTKRVKEAAGSALWKFFETEEQALAWLDQERIQLKAKSLSTIAT
jgi:hypothetical protein